MSTIINIDKTTKKNESSIKSNIILNSGNNNNNTNGNIVSDNSDGVRDNDCNRNINAMKYFKTCFIYFIICTYIMIMFQLSIEFKAPKQVILYDSLFNFFREIPDSEGIIEMLVNVTFIYTIARICMLGKSVRIIAICHVLLTVGTCYILRGVILSSTLLPNPFPNCDSMLDQKHPLLFNAFLVLIKFRRTCNDVMFSGHSMSLVVFSCISWYYFKRIEALIVSFVSFIAAIFIISARFHYTCDVLIGGLIGIFVFHLILYKYQIQCQFAKYHKRKSILLKYFIPYINKSKYFNI